MYHGPASEIHLPLILQRDRWRREKIIIICYSNEAPNGKSVVIRNNVVEFYQQFWEIFRNGIP